MTNVVISGVGHYLPSRIVRNEDVERLVETTSAFIREKTGVLERRYMAPEQSLADMILPAAQDALTDAGRSAADVDLLIVNTLSPDYQDPSQACYIQPLLGCRQIPSFDIRAQCSGSLYGFDIGRKFLVDGTYKVVMVICAEALSKGLDTSFSGRNLSILLGDGAAACILERSQEDDRGFIDILLGADGTKFDLLKTDAVGSGASTTVAQKDLLNEQHHFQMQGRLLGADAVRRISQSCLDILYRNRLSIDDIDIIIPHQANLRLLEEVMHLIGVGRERFFLTIETLGNMASASFPIALSLARRQDLLPPGSLSLFVTYGAGSTWGAALYRS